MNRRDFLELATKLAACLAAAGPALGGALRSRATATAGGVDLGHIIAASFDLENDLEFVEDIFAAPDDRALSLMPVVSNRRQTAELTMEATEQAIRTVWDIWHDGQVSPFTVHINDGGDLFQFQFQGIVQDARFCQIDARAAALATLEVRSCIQ